MEGRKRGGAQLVRVKEEAAMAARDERDGGGDRRGGGATQLESA